MKRFAFLLASFLCALPCQAADFTVVVDTAVTLPVNIMPLVDDDDFVTRKDAVAWNEPGMELTWNFVTTGGVMTQTEITPTTSGNYDWTTADTEANGMYKIEMTATGGASANNDTEGFGWFTGVATDVAAWRGPTIAFVKSNVALSMIDGSDKLDVNVEEWNTTSVPAENTAGYPIVTVKDGTGTGEIDTASGIAKANAVQISDDATAADNAEKMYDGTGYGPIVYSAAVTAVTTQSTIEIASANPPESNAFTGMKAIIRDNGSTDVSERIITASLEAQSGTDTELTLESNVGFTVGVGDTVEIHPASFGGSDRTDLDAVLVDTSTALPNAPPNANGGLPILSSSGTALGYTVPTVTTVTTLTNLPTIPANWLTAAGAASDFGTEIGNAVGAHDFSSDTTANTFGNSFRTAPDFSDEMATGLSAGGYTPERAGFLDNIEIAPLRPTVENRTVDVTSTGAVAIDFANVENPTSTVNLSGTTVGTSSTIGTTGVGAIWNADINTYDNTSGSFGKRLGDNVDAQISLAGGSSSVLLSTTVASGSGTSYVLSAGSDVNDAYNGQSIVFYDASNSDYPSVVTATDYVGSTRTLTVDAAPVFTVAASDGVKIFVGSSFGGDVAVDLSPVQTVVDAIKAKTDNLPVDPADQSLLLAQHTQTQADIADVEASVEAIEITPDVEVVGGGPVEHTPVSESNSYKANRRADGTNSINGMAKYTSGDTDWYEVDFANRLARGQTLDAMSEPTVTGNVDLTVTAWGVFGTKAKFRVVAESDATGTATVNLSVTPFVGATIRCEVPFRKTP